MLKVLLPLILAVMPAFADPMIVFSLSGVPFHDDPLLPPNGFNSLYSDFSIIGVDTPLHSGVTANHGVPGVAFGSGLLSQDASNYYMGPGTLIIESSFNFSGAFVPGDIGIFQYQPVWHTPAFTIPKDTMSFVVSAFGLIDPRLAAFYGLAPPCLTLGDPAGCPNPTWYATFAATGTQLDDRGFARFGGTITAQIVPEPSSILLLATVVLGFAGWRLVTKSLRVPAQAISETRG